VRIFLDVGFAHPGWQVSVDSRGWVKGTVEGAPFSSTSVPEDTLLRIRGLARCVAAIPGPALRGPAIIDTPAPPPPLLFLRVRVGHLERKIGVSQEILQGADLSNTGAAFRLLLELRNLVPSQSAYDYRPWLKELVASDSDRRCPWLRDVSGE
jgi:hypothetical protein